MQLKSNHYCTPGVWYDHSFSRMHQYRFLRRAVVVAVRKAED